MNQSRRSLLRAGGGAAVLGLAAVVGLLHPARVWAAQWNKSAFDAKGLPDAFKAIGATATVESREITITAPEIAENGAVVPVQVTSTLPNTQSITIFADKNPAPMVAEFTLPEGTDGYIATRIKMGQSSTVRAVVKAGGKFYQASREVKVTIGGCGG